MHLPQQVRRPRTVAEVVAAVRNARRSNARLVPRGGGHCFADRVSTADVILELKALDAITVASNGVVELGAGVVLGTLYPALEAAGRAIPAGCGPTVGIAGLTLGGGIGLLGRMYGLTCDRLLGAQVVLADGTVVDCDDSHEPDLFWALRGAGGGQFGIVTALRFETVPAPELTRVTASWAVDDAEQLVAAWQAWSPETPDELTINLTITAVNPPGRPQASLGGGGPQSPASPRPLQAVVVGASLLGERATRGLVRELAELAGDDIPFEVRGGMRLPELKQSFNGPADDARIRSEFFDRSLSDPVLAELLQRLKGRASGRLSFTAMGGAYNRVSSDATAFAHRGVRFLLEHAGTPDWVDASWAVAHRDGSGRVYPNFPDPALADGPSAYHGVNLSRLRAVKQAYDPDRFFDFPQAL
nr:FAD-binding oxidoreductase [Kribbella jejuensis]